MIKVGIIGGAGYTAGELIRLLINHPEAEIVFINSSSNAGNKITDVHEGLYGETDLVFTDELPLDKIDVLFFCTPLFRFLNDRQKGFTYRSNRVFGMWGKFRKYFLLYDSIHFQFL